ncbi:MULTISPECIES: type I pantothenate kinase [Shewanella]|jgi:type I pantothenate kinase|uniref:Pantothenate kinase n=1 Tax=Shewanella algae TaxID=38313 RepID=A0A2T3GW94_9GAMM|nr:MULTISPECIES: type I pantothenate kinase [Shewanella]AYV11982.1 type I pantothenate kinase [Shewanella algae]MBC8797677.1 type I pantothenate kinase [Shewanella algae]MBO2550574.1 type I pantothenate kinase [Shewanella algae]MBO2554906.1 type I pantothenate kinase [Shewanella algae]MBO2559215.1 type I pantothenate kinase [Shewanella algae]
MTTANSIQQALYMPFHRQQWAELRESVPLTLSETELKKLRGINEKVSLTEVTDIYLPLSRLLNLIVGAKQQRGLVLNEFLGQTPAKSPYIISIAGSVAVGKSTTARILQALLSHWPEHPKVDLITTDGFLYPLAELKQKGLLQRKGFPESYDMKLLVEFIAAIKSGAELVEAPLYSHISYDRLPEVQQVRQPDILILEGLNVLQTELDSPVSIKRPFVSDFVDFSIYVDADESLLKHWYIDRFLQFRHTAFANERSYFHHYAKLSDAEAEHIAANIWDTINGPNLNLNIEPTRERAHLILKKGQDHLMDKVLLRK